MNREKKLLKNSILFAIGSIGGKFMQFLLLPFYTYMLTSEQYGQIDILQNVVTLLMPAVSLSITEGVFRYAMDAGEDKSAVFSVGVSILGISGFSTLLLLQITEAFFHVPYLFLMWLYLFSNLLFSLFTQFVKAIEKNKLFTASNLLQTTLICAASIFFLRFLHAGLYGYFSAYIVGNLFCVILVFCAARLWRYVRLERSLLSQPLTRKMLQFCIPLVPNAICWWVINFSDRIMIHAMYGYSAEGIYAIAHKFPTIIMTAMNVFFSAWQVSANQEYQSADGRAFFAKIYILLQHGLVAIITLIIPCSRLLCAVLFSESFFEAWRYVPVMLLGILAFCLAQFLGSVYSASKKTKMAFFTNMITAVINVLLNFIFLRSIGVYGAALATTISFLIQWLIRAWNIHTFFSFPYAWKKTILNFSLLTIEIIAATLSEGLVSLWAAGLMIVLLAINVGPIASFLLAQFHAKTDTKG